MKLVLYLLLVALACACAAAAWRFFMFRNNGTQGVFRELPAEGFHGWRHGVLRYDGDELHIYKLRSLSLRNDVALHRTFLSVEGMRDLSPDERCIIPDCEQAVVVSGEAGRMEFALEVRAQMALISWIEAAPDVRQVPVDKLALRRHISHSED